MLLLIASFVTQQTIGIVAGGRLRPSAKQTMYTQWEWRTAGCQWWYAKLQRSLF